jgi:hypothetical protein
MKALTFNLLTKIQLFILMMQEYTERRWKEITSPSISDLFAQARRDMEEEKPLPEVPPEMHSTKKLHQGELLFCHALLSIGIFLVYILMPTYISPLKFPELYQITHSVWTEALVMGYLVVSLIRLVTWTVTRP